MVQKNNIAFSTLVSLYHYQIYNLSGKEWYDDEEYIHCNNYTCSPTSLVCKLNVYCDGHCNLCACKDNDYTFKRLSNDLDKTFANVSDFIKYLLTADCFKLRKPETVESKYWYSDYIKRKFTIYGLVEYEQGLQYSNTDIDGNIYNAPISYSNAAKLVLYCWSPNTENKKIIQTLDVNYKPIDFCNEVNTLPIITNKINFVNYIYNIDCDSNPWVIYDAYTKCIGYKNIKHWCDPTLDFDEIYNFYVKYNESERAKKYVELQAKLKEISEQLNNSYRAYA